MGKVAETSTGIKSPRAKVGGIRRPKRKAQNDTPKRAKLNQTAKVAGSGVLKADEQKPLPSLEKLRKKLKKISASIPNSEWAKLPEDGSINVDHYLYGTPKRS